MNEQLYYELVGRQQIDLFMQLKTIRDLEAKIAQLQVDNDHLHKLLNEAGKVEIGEPVKVGPPPNGPSN